MKKTLFISLLCLAITLTIFGQKHNSTMDFSLSPLGVAWGFQYGYPPTQPVKFIPSLHELGIRSTKVYLFWHQIEPEKGKYNWAAIDSLVAQIKLEDHVLVCLFSSSTWATRTSSAVLPPSPAKLPDDYYHFVYEVVKRCGGKVKYWQNDSEPNNSIFWNGSVDEFISETKIFHNAVKDADPDANVVLGGYDGLFTPPGYYFQYPDQEKSLQFFRKTISEASGYFDIFDIRLYGDPYTIPYRVNYFKQVLKDVGNNQPIICTEYHGPGFYEFPENGKYSSMVIKWQQAIASNDLASLSQLKNPLSELYSQLGTLSPQTEMFMMGCVPELTNKLRRLQSREIVMRNMLAFSSGVKSTMYWDLWEDSSDTLDITTLMYGKQKLMEMNGTKLTTFYPHAKIISLLSQQLAHFIEIKHIELEKSPKLFLFKVAFADSKKMFVAWEQRDTFTGEDNPPTPYSILWDSKEASATDLFGKAIATKVQDGKLLINISQDPVFIIP